MTNVNRVTITTIEYKAEDFLSKLGLDATDSELVRLESVVVNKGVNNGFGHEVSTVKIVLESEVEERNAA
jgi:hypothetical protein